MNKQRTVGLPSKTGQPMTCQNCVESSILITYKHVMSVALEKDRLLSAFNSLL